MRRRILLELKPIDDLDLKEPKKRPARSHAASSTLASFADMPSRSQMRDKDRR